MGKGLIIGALGDGKYSVQLKFDKDGLQGRVASIDAQVSDLNTRIAGMEDGIEKSILQLRVKSLQKAKERYQTVLNTTDPTLDVWCTDFSLDLQGEVGTIEVIRNRDKGILLRPNYDQSAAYNSARDGQLAPALEVGPYTNFYNMAITPGMQKWKPIYRVGTVTGISGDNCDITLDNILSSQQDLGVNQTSTLANVPIDYMDCNGEVFAVDDRVIVEFTGNSWDSPKVIGFESEPKNCSDWVYKFCFHITSGYSYPPSLDDIRTFVYGEINKLTGELSWITEESISTNYNLNSPWEYDEVISGSMFENEGSMTPTDCKYDAEIRRFLKNGADPRNVLNTYDHVTTVYTDLPNHKKIGLNITSNNVFLNAGSDYSILYLYNIGYYQKFFYEWQENGWVKWDIWAHVPYFNPETGQWICTSWTYSHVKIATIVWPYGGAKPTAVNVSDLYGRGDDDFDEWADNNPCFPKHYALPPCQAGECGHQYIITYNGEAEPYQAQACLWDTPGYPSQEENPIFYLDRTLLATNNLTVIPWTNTNKFPTRKSYDYQTGLGFTQIVIRTLENGNYKILANVLDTGETRLFEAEINSSTGAIISSNYSTGSFSIESNDKIIVDESQDINTNEGMYPSNRNLTQWESMLSSKFAELGASSAGIIRLVEK